MNHVKNVVSLLSAAALLTLSACAKEERAIRG